MYYPPATATIHHLENGLTVILDPRNSHPVVSVQIWVETGSVYEDQLLGAGVSHFLEHMVFKGTKKFSGDTLSALVTAAGGHWNAYTTFDRTVYHIDGASSGLDTFIDVLTEMVFRPTLDITEFEKEKDVIRREIDMGHDDPSTRATRLLLSTAFRNDARALPVIGERALFDEISHSDLTKYHHSRYTANRSFYVISGDFNAPELLEKIKAIASDLPLTHYTEPYVCQDDLQCTLLRASEAFDVSATKLTLAWKIPSLGHVDAPAYDLLAAILGAGRSSPLVQSLREQTELALEIGAWNWMSFQGAGLFAISAECQPENAELLEQEALSLLEKITLPELENHLDKAKRQLTNQQLRPLTTASGRAADLASNWHETRNLNFTHDYVLSIQNVSADDVYRCLKSLTKNKLTITSLVPLSQENEVTKKHTKNLLENHAANLSNGLRVSFFPDDSLPLVSIQCVVRSGLLSENENNSGINQLLAATITHGTRHRDSLSIAKIIDRLGASIHASAGNNCIIIGASCLREDLPTILELLAEIIQVPTFPADAVSREKNSQLSALKESLSDPLDLAFLSLRQTIFANAGYGLSLQGSIASIPLLTSEMLQAHHAAYFTADTMTMSVAGSFSSGEMSQLLEKHFSSLPRTAEHHYVHSQVVTDRRVENMLDKKQAVVVVGFPASTATDETRFAQQIIHHYLADMSGPLFMKIREVLGLAYQVGATHFLGVDAGMFACYLSTSPEQLSYAQNELLLELQRITNDGLGEQEFEQAKISVLSAQALSQQSPAAMARQSALDMLFHMPYDQYKFSYEKIQSLQLKEINHLIHKIFSQAPVVSVVRP